MLWIRSQHTLYIVTDCKGRNLKVILIYKDKKVHLHHNLYCSKQKCVWEHCRKVKKIIMFLCNRVFAWVEWLTKSPVEYWFIKTKARVFVQKRMAWLKLNEIWSIIKMWSFNKGEHSRKGGWGSFVVRRFYNSYENLIELTKYHYNFIFIVFKNLLCLPLKCCPLWTFVCIT